MEEIFNNSKFGDRFKTRDGRIALYIGRNMIGVYYFIIKSRYIDEIEPTLRYEDGRVSTKSISDDDIVKKLSYPCN